MNLPPEEIAEWPCPHCSHPWSSHGSGTGGHAPPCYCGCLWRKPKPRQGPPPPPTAHDLLVARVVDAIWEGFEAEDYAYADRQMDIIDTGGNYETFSMERVAQHVIHRLGLT